MSWGSEGSNKKGGWGEVKQIRLLLQSAAFPLPQSKPAATSPPASIHCLLSTPAPPGHGRGDQVRLLLSSAANPLSQSMPLQHPRPAQLPLFCPNPLVHSRHKVHSNWPQPSPRARFGHRPQVLHIDLRTSQIRHNLDPRWTSGAVSRHSSN